MSYKDDLTTANERDVRCAKHPHRRATMMDLDDDGNQVPCCEVCWSARWPKIRLRLAEQRLIQGGLPPKGRTP